MDNIEKIVNYLMLTCDQISDVSLYHGKTGIVLTLMLYAKKTNSNSVKCFAEECFNSIYNGIHDGMPLGIESGLAGVGYGVTLMNKAGLINCDLNDVLFNIDSKIMETDPRRFHDFAFSKGLSGIMAYINLRLQVEGQVATFDSLYLDELTTQLNTADDIVQFELSKKIIEDIEAPFWNENDYISKPISIHEGSSYYLLKKFYDKVLFD